MTSNGLTSTWCSSLHLAASNDLLLPKITEFSEAHVNSDMLGAGSEAFGTMFLKSGGHSSSLALSYSSPYISMGLAWVAPATIAAVKRHELSTKYVLRAPRKHKGQTFTCINSDPGK